jgi:ABC-type thiamin/hydroxymethylpyrimidine transport system permease subunit
MNTKVKFGLTLGIFFAFMHFVWYLAVAIGIGQNFLDWIYPLHAIGNVFTVMGFNFLNMIFLLIVAFISGFVCGWLGVWVYGWFDKKKRK